MGAYFLAGVLLVIYFDVRSQLSRIANAMEAIQEFLEYGDDADLDEGAHD